MRLNPRTSPGLRTFSQLALTTVSRSNLVSFMDGKIARAETVSRDTTKDDLNMALKEAGDKSSEGNGSK